MVHGGTSDAHPLFSIPISHLLADILRKLVCLCIQFKLAISKRFHLVLDHPVSYSFSPPTHLEYLQDLVKQIHHTSKEGPIFR